MTLLEKYSSDRDLLRFNLARLLPSLSESKKKEVHEVLEKVHDYMDLDPGELEKEDKQAIGFRDQVVIYD